MNHLSLSLRILAGFGAVLLLLAVVGASGILGLGTTLDQLDVYAEGVSLTVSVMQAQNDLEAAVRGAQSPADNGAPGIADDARKAGQRVDAAPRQAQASAPGDLALLLRDVASARAKNDHTPLA
jgi:hypothetical protein